MPRPVSTVGGVLGVVLPAFIAGRSVLYGFVEEFVAFFHFFHVACNILQILFCQPTYFKCSGLGRVQNNNLGPANNESGSGTLTNDDITSKHATNATKQI